MESNESHLFEDVSVADRLWQNDDEVDEGCAQLPCLHMLLPVDNALSAAWSAVLHHGHVHVDGQ